MQPVSTLISPYRGELVDLVVPSERHAEVFERASRLPSLQISDRCVCDLELLAVGGFSPLRQFMGKADFDRVVAEMRLSDGTLWPMPITLPFDGHEDVTIGSEIALRDSHYNLLAVMRVDEMYEWDREAYCKHVLGTTDERHPLVAESGRWGRYNLAGPLEVLQLPLHYDFKELRLTPVDTRASLAATGRAQVVAFQTRNPLHRAHEELTKRACAEVDGALLLHPSVGMTRPGDIDHYTRVRAYKALAKYYDPDRFVLALLPLAMRMAGPREALWHAIIRRNYGAGNFIVGRDHAGPGNDSTGKPFYGPYDAQQLVEKYSEEIGVRVIPFKMLVYIPGEDRYEEVDKVPPGVQTANISGTQVREVYLEYGKTLPPWFSRPEVAAILTEEYPDRYHQGFCIWFTGLSGAGKSTVADVLTSLMLENGRHVTVLDGDVVRTMLSKGLTFSRDDRDLNIRRIGYVASEVVKHGGATIAVAVSPYRATRNEVRAMMKSGHFIEVYVDTPLNVCEQRDVKGLYAKARRGEIKGFTGIDDPFEPPEKPEIVVDTQAMTAEQNARKILDYLLQNGFVHPA